MPRNSRLSAALTRARKRRGWSPYKAANRIGFPSTNTLRTLEGRNPDRNPGGADCKLSTVLDIIEVYWPDVTLEDFAGRKLLFKLVPKNVPSDRVLKHADTG
jgi:hypothetical protein